MDLYGKPRDPLAELRAYKEQQRLLEVEVFWRDDLTEELEAIRALVEELEGEE